MVDAKIRFANLETEIDATARELSALWQKSKSGISTRAQREEYARLRSRMTDLLEQKCELKRELGLDVRELEESFH